MLRWIATYQGGESYTVGGKTYRKGVAETVTDPRVAAYLKITQGFSLREERLVDPPASLPAVREEAEVPAPEEARPIVASETLVPPEEDLTQEPLDLPEDSTDAPRPKLHTKVKIKGSVIQKRKG